MADPLLPHHRVMLEASAISPAVIAQRGYRSVTKKVHIQALGFSPAQCRVPALVIPVFDVMGQVALHQIRPDDPRANTEGKPIKYETPKGAKMSLDIPLRARPDLGNPRRPLFITEGIKKADSAVSHGLCCVAVLGVWNWRGTNDEGGKTVLAAWESIALEGREVYIVFDSDVSLKPEVYQALLRLKGFLESRKARVRVIYLDPKTDGGKVGLDDFFAAGGILAQLLALATEHLRHAPAVEPRFPYWETDLGLVYLMPARDGGHREIPLCNFTARVVTQCVEDDGVEKTHTFDIQVRLGERVATVHLPSWEKFKAMNWHVEALGIDAAIAPWQAAPTHIGFAVQRFSEGAPTRTLYKHTGWREIDDAWAYLHAGGAIGADGPVAGVEVGLPQELAGFILPNPPEGEELKTAIRASLRVRTVAPDILTFPILAATYRAVMGDCDFSGHVAGSTGLGKSELVALAQQHFGPALDARHLLSWESSANYVAEMCFLAKDSLVGLDDYVLTGSTADIQRKHRDADRVLRGQGNRSGRGRMKADTTLRPPKPPRTVVLSTGEEIPRGHSLRARILILDPAKGDVKWPILTDCQKDAAEGLYAQSLAGFVRWLAPQYEAIKKKQKAELDALRDLALQGNHKRTPGITANLALGFRYFLQFAEESGAISAEERIELDESCWDALSGAASDQAHHQEATEPARRFIQLVQALLSSGEAYLATPSLGSSSTLEPQDPEAWGWWYDGNHYHTKGPKIGWIDDDDIYLEPEASYACAQKLASTHGEPIPVSAQTLRRRLKEEGFLASWDDARQTVTVRRMLEGRQHAVLHLTKNIFSEPPSLRIKNPTNPTNPTFPSETPGNGTENGAVSGSYQSMSGCKNDQPDIDLTDLALKSQAKSSTNSANVGIVGIVGFNSTRERGPQEKKIRGLFDGENGVEDVGLSKDEIPTSANRNPTDAGEGTKTWKG